jgi:ketosteroid isomerase-like protein
MKRCPACQTVYTDDSLSFCLQDGSRLVSVTASAHEPPPTEIMRTEDFPTVPVDATPATVAQARGRQTTPEREPQAVTQTASAPRRDATLVALSATVVILLVALGGLLYWIATRDKEVQRVVNGTENQRTTQRNANEERSSSSSSSSNNSSSPNANSSSNTTPQASPVDVAALQKEVQATLNAWAETVRERNLEEHMKYYAETLEVYYGASNVSRERVRADREAAFSKYSSLDMHVDNFNITFEASGQRAVATFDKTFDFRNDEKSYNGSGLNRFWLTKSGGRWRITGERELKTYYVNK